VSLLTSLGLRTFYGRRLWKRSGRLDWPIILDGGSACGLAVGLGSDTLRGGTYKLRVGSIIRGTLEADPPAPPQPKRLLSLSGPPAITSLRSSCEASHADLRVSSS